MLFEQGAALTLGHAAPDTELHPVVQCVGSAFGDHRAVPADHRGLALRGAADEQFVGIGLAAACLRNPGDAGLSFSLNDTIDRSGSSNCPVSYWLSTCHSNPFVTPSHDGPVSA